MFYQADEGGSKIEDTVISTTAAHKGKFPPPIYASAPIPSAAKATIAGGGIGK